MRRLSLAIAIICLVAYSLAAFAYMHSTFIDKDYMSLVVKQLDRMEIKLDELQ